MSTIHQFSALGIAPEYTDRLSALEISIPTAVQAAVIPEIAHGHNVIFQSDTGTGKTLAYLLPLIQTIEKQVSAPKNVNLLIAAPTYELASQINTTVKSVSNLRAALLIGGTPLRRQSEILKTKPVVVTGNPARLLELIRLKKLKTAELSAAVLDEADRLFAPEMRAATEQLLSCLPHNIQIAAASATIPAKTEKYIRAVLQKTGSDKELKTIYLPAENILQTAITHWAIYAERRDKIETLRKFLAAEKPSKAIVFTSRPDQVENIVSKLSFRGSDCIALHARADKKDRKSAIDKFRNGKCKILVTSDLSARGLDVRGITHIIQMDLPQNDDAFIHRTGRTARAGSKGINVVIGDDHEMRRFAALEKRLGIIVYPKILWKGKVCVPTVPDETSCEKQ
jgi:superfamily II DNA/RNA helicase